MTYLFLWQFCFACWKYYQRVRKSGCKDLCCPCSRCDDREWKDALQSFFISSWFLVEVSAWFALFRYHQRQRRTGLRSAVTFARPWHFDPVLTLLRLLHTVLAATTTYFIALRAKSCGEDIARAGRVISPASPPPYRCTRRSAWLISLAPKGW